VTFLVHPPSAFAPKKALLAFLKEMHPHRAEPEVKAAIKKVKGYLEDRAKDPEYDRLIEESYKQQT
jgi:hypothetical protein